MDNPKGNENKYALSDSGIIEEKTTSKIIPRAKYSEEVILSNAIKSLIYKLKVSPAKIKAKNSLNRSRGRNRK